MIRAFLISLLFTSLSFGQTITLPAKVEVEPGRLASVVVEWDGDDISWIASPELDVFREYDANPKVIRLRVLPAQVGLFKIIAVTCKDKKLSPWSTCEVIVGKPGPAPGPTPGPDDALSKALQVAFTSDKGEADAKAKYKAALVGVYKAASGLDLSKVNTAGQLFGVLTSSSKSVLSDENLFSTRTAITPYLKEILPKAPDAVLTDDHRSKAKALFERLVLALEKVK